MIINMRFLLKVMLLLMVINNAPIYGQSVTDKSDEDSEMDKITISTEVLSFEVSVRDHKGQILSQLRSNDLSIYEDGQQREISHLNKISAPTNLVLIVDTSSSVNSYREIIQQYIYDLIDRLNPDDRIAVLQFKDRPIWLANFFYPKEVNRLALENLGQPVIITDGVEYFSSEGSAIYDALALATTSLEKVEGHKAILLISDWIDTGSLRSFDMVRTRLEKSNTNLFVMKIENQKAAEAYIRQGGGLTTRQFQKYFKKFPCKDCIVHNDGKNSLENCDNCLDDLNSLPRENLCEINRELYKIAADEIAYLISHLGGRLFSIKDIEELHQTHDLLIDNLHAVYSIGYYPEGVAPEKRWHKIEIKTTIPKIELFYKKSFFY